MLPFFFLLLLAQGDTHVALQARLMSQAMRKLTATVARTNCLLIFINQIRLKVGVMFGSPETTPGGNALKFYASVRLDIRRSGGMGPFSVCLPPPIRPCVPTRGAARAHTHIGVIPGHTFLRKKQKCVGPPSGGSPPPLP